MATHLAAYTESQDSAVLVPVNIVQDDILVPFGADRFQVPAERPEIMAAAALGISLTRAQFVAPSLEVKRATQEIFPHERGDDVFTLDGARYYKPMRPIVLEPGENLEFQAAEDGATTRTYGLVWLKPVGELPAMPSGDIRRARATSTQTLTANLWTSCTLTMEKDLERGLYSIVGMHCSSATAIAARVIIPGLNNRPGVPALAGTEAAARDFDGGWLKDFNGYDFGVFDSRAIPQVQFLASAADTAETVVFSLVKVG